MSNFAVLLLKEERALFSSPIAYVVMTVFLLIMGYSFTLSLFLSHQPSLVQPRRLSPCGSSPRSGSCARWRSC
jgi:hypothetical protein